MDEFVHIHKETHLKDFNSYQIEYQYTQYNNTTRIFLMYYFSLSIIFQFGMYRLPWIIPLIWTPLWPLWYSKWLLATLSIYSRGVVLPIIIPSYNLSLWPLPLTGLYLLIHFFPKFSPPDLFTRTLPVSPRLCIHMNWGTDGKECVFYCLQAV